MRVPYVGPAETPYLLGGVLIIAASVRTQGGFTKAIAPALLATFGIMTVAAFLAATRAAPIVRAFGFLYLIAAASLAVRAWTTPTRNTK